MAKLNGRDHTIAYSAMNVGATCTRRIARVVTMALKLGYNAWLS